MTSGSAALYSVICLSVISEKTEPSTPSLFHSVKVSWGMLSWRIRCCSWSTVNALTLPSPGRLSAATTSHQLTASLWQRDVKPAMLGLASVRPRILDLASKLIFLVSDLQPGPLRRWAKTYLTCYVMYDLLQRLAINFLQYTMNVSIKGTELKSGDRMVYIFFGFRLLRTLSFSESCVFDVY